MAAKLRSRPAAMFDDGAPLPPPPPGFVPDDRLGDGASVGFRLLCLDRAIDVAPNGAQFGDVIRGAEEIRLYLLGTHPIATRAAAAEAAAAEAKSLH